MALEVDGVELATDDQGFLIDPDAWNYQVAEVIAQQQDLQLGAEHRQVLDFIRQHYTEHHVAVDARFVIKFLADELGYGKRARRRLYDLFPYGYLQQVCKIAGLRMPRGWSTG